MFCFCDNISEFYLFNIEILSKRKTLGSEIRNGKDKNA